MLRPVASGEAGFFDFGKGRAFYLTRKANFVDLLLGFFRLSGI